jgi:hypothetical protein
VALMATESLEWCQIGADGAKMNGAYGGSKPVSFKSICIFVFPRLLLNHLNIVVDDDPVVRCCALEAMKVEKK